MDSKKSFTHDVAWELVRREVRTRPGLLTSWPIIDRLQGLVSFFTGTLIMLVGIVGMLMLIPGYLIAKLIGYKPASDDGTVTAVLTLMARSQMNLLKAGGPDWIAPVLLRGKSILGTVFGPVWGGSFWSEAYLYLQRVNFYLTQRILQEQTAKWEPQAPIGGLCTYLQCRTCWLDDCVEAFHRLHDGKKTNLVILGAGYDSRCYRLPNLENATTYEVDKPNVQAAKLKSMKDAGINTGNTKFVSCDFLTQDWMIQLHSSGFERSLPTLLVWEGVTMYLTKEVVEATLNHVAGLAKGSCIGFDYLDSSWIFSAAAQKSFKSTDEPILFGMNGNEPEELVAANRLFILDHLKTKELVDRYVTKHCDGRPLGHIGDFGGFVLAGNFEV